MVSVIQFQQLAETYSIDCEIMLRERRWSSAYYLAGYVVECAVKACLLKSIPAASLPPLSVARTFYSHNLDELLKAAKLEPELRREPQLLRDRWGLVLEWRPESRYLTYPEKEARDMVEAVNDSQQGVLQWLKNNW